MARILPQLVLAMFFSSTFEWRLKSSQQNVIPQVTEDVTLRCDNVMEVTLEEKWTFKQITKIRLLKSKSNSRLNSRWKSIAEINVPDNSLVTLVDGIDSEVITSGLIGAPTQSFLSVTWPTASLETVGSYKCEVEGVNVRGKNLNATPKKMTITNHDPSIKDLASIVTQMKVKLTEKIEKQIKAHDTILRDSELKIKSQLLDIMNKVSHMSDKLDKLTLAHEILHREIGIKTENQTYEIINKVKHMTSEKLGNLTIAHYTIQRETEVMIKNQILDVTDKIRHMSNKLDKLTMAQDTLQRDMDIHTKSQTYEIMNTVKDMCANKKLGPPIDNLPWPTGEYSLLATSDGCPDSRTGNPFRHGYITVQSKTNTIPRHATSAASHLSRPFYERRNSFNNLNFRFCSLVTSVNYIVPWPKGSYCINRYVFGLCPDNFEIGDIAFILESISDTVAKSNNSAGFGHDPSRRQTALAFCCRSDGKQSDAIRLPASKPFYLYRYGGVCQSVFNMDVTNEWILLDTDDRKMDFYDGTHYPDSSISDFRLELCYYEARLP